MNPDDKISDEIKIEDSTPSILDQAKSNNWQCEYYNFGKAESRGYQWFNPSIVQRPDGLWLLVRGSEPHPEGFNFGQNNVWAFMLDDTGTIPKMGKKLKWLVKDGSQHFEDPRGFYHPTMNQTVIGACTFCWYPKEPWTGAHQVFGMFDENWVCTRMFYPKVGGNPGRMEKIVKHENYEKNWLWFLHNSQLHLLYKARPWMVVEFRETWTDRHDYKDESGAMWAWGDIRGGTPPIKVGNLYFTFHHSSLPWKSRYRRYYAGVTAFEAQPPFRPKLITKEPIFIGSQNDVWMQRKPLVVFPCGAIFKDGEWFVTMGVNDVKAAWAKIPHKDILSRMIEIGKSETIFIGSGLSPVEARKEKLRANLVKARAARAAKREKFINDYVEVAKDIIQVRPRKRRRKRYRRITAEARTKALQEYEHKKNLATDKVEA